MSDQSGRSLSCREYRPEDLDPAFVLWMEWVKDVYDEDKEAGMDMMIGYVAKVMVEARRG